MKQIKVAPSVMCANIQNLLDDIVKLEAAGADLFHFDIMDGHFVPNLTFGPHIVRGLRSATNLPFCAHLMVTRPDHFIPIFVDTGCQIIEVHAESEGELVRSLRLIRSLGSSPARSRAWSAARRPVSTLVYSTASWPARTSALRVSRM